MSTLALVIIPVVIIMIMLVVVYVLYVATVTGNDDNKHKHNFAFYDKCDFGGKQVNHSAVLDDVDVLDFEHGKIRSIWIPDGFYITIYSEKHLRGQHATFRGSIPCLDDHWTKSIKSAIVHRHHEHHKHHAPSTMHPLFKQDDIKRFLDNIDAQEIIAVCKKDASNPCHSSIGALSQPLDFTNMYVRPLEQNIDVILEELNDLIDLMSNIVSMKEPSVVTYCEAITTSALLKTIFGTLPLRWIKSSCMKSETIHDILQIQSADRSFFTQTCPSLVAELAAAGLPKNATNLKTLFRMTDRTTAVNSPMPRNNARHHG